MEMSFLQQQQASEMYSPEEIALIMAEKEKKKRGFRKKIINPFLIFKRRDVTLFVGMEVIWPIYFFPLPASLAPLILIIYDVLTLR